MTGAGPRGSRAAATPADYGIEAMLLGCGNYRGSFVSSHLMVRGRHSSFTRAACVLALALLTQLAFGLTRNPRDIPSPLIGRPVPHFAVPPVQGRALGLAAADLRGEVSLVNVFASWCAACKDEHPVFMRLKHERFVPLHGINYKDRPEDAAGWLDGLGDPYTRTGADISGRVSIDWGLHGVRDTFVIDREGRIASKHIGAVTPELLERTLKPLIAKLRR